MFIHSVMSPAKSPASFFRLFVRKQVYGKAAGLEMDKERIAASGVTEVDDISAVKSTLELYAPMYL